MSNGTKKKKIRNRNQRKTRKNDGASGNVGNGYRLRVLIVQDLKGLKVMD